RGLTPMHAICPFRDNCAYFAQLHACEAADIVIMAHNYLIEGLREYQKHLLDNVNAVIIEEDINHNITYGTVRLPDTAFNPDQIGANPVRTEGREDAALTAKLVPLYTKLNNIVVDIGEGEHPEAAVAKRGLTVAQAKLALSLTQKRRVPDKMYPGM